jgi:SAM-dependent methyltransferase
VTEKPYLDFYAKQGARLVSRDIDDKGKFFRARESLYIALGISPGFLRGKTVIEFGPGTGHNALYTDWLGPSRFVLVDGGPDILAASKERLVTNGSDLIEREFICSLFDDYNSMELFDFVIAEGCIPNQTNPVDLFKKIQRFVKPGGLMLFTTVSPVSWLSEIFRRLAKNRIVSLEMSEEEQVNLMVSKLEGHFDTLNNMARTPEEWILDNLFQPHGEGKLFTIPDSLNNLSSEFIVSGTSPTYYQDWTWYKDVAHSNTERNARFIETYFSNVLNFVDRRLIFPTHSQELGRQVEEIASNIWCQACRIEKGEVDLWDETFEYLSQLSLLISSEAPQTSKSIDEAAKWIRGGLREKELLYFPSWWGRGQQHVCICRGQV